MARRRTFEYHYGEEIGMSKTPEELKYQREYRIRTNNVATRKYEKTINGFLMRLYRNMESRITGVQWKKAHLYEGKYLLPREEFYSWALSSREFQQLFEDWTVSDYERRLAPSVDRVDSDKGYEVSNMEWVTMSENSRRGAVSKWRIHERV